MQVRYRGLWDTAMLAHYCRSIKRAMVFASHSRRSLKPKITVLACY